MLGLFFLAFSILISGGTLLCALLIGTWMEQRHLRRLDAAEFELRGIVYTDLKRLPDNWSLEQGYLVAGEAVIANDKFKRWLAGWINVFGGTVTVYEAMLERARRQAIVRTLESARDLGCNVVWNLRLETSMIQTGKSAGVEALVYGTAFKIAADRPPPIGESADSLPIADAFRGL